MLNISSIEDRLKKYQPMWENWYIDSQIYNGANSRVYRIKRSRDGEDEFAALKVVTVTLDDDKMLISHSDGLRYLDDRCQKAKSEINNMRKLQRSPNVVSYYDDVVKEIFDESGQKCGYDMLIRMEYLTCFGTKIRSSDCAITLQGIINMAFDIGNALKAIHKCNMIHRDIKPDNIFVDEFGTYKLGDLGVTKNLNATGYASTKTGTEPYAAPEVWRSDSFNDIAYTHKADIYSFGIVLYQLLNNNYLPFMEDFTHNELEKSIAFRMRGDLVPPPANGSDGLKNIICKMCEFKPENRHADMDEFLNELSAVGSQKETADTFIKLADGEIDQDMITTLDANDDVPENIVSESAQSSGDSEAITEDNSTDISTMTDDPLMRSCESTEITDISEKNESDSIEPENIEQDNVEADSTKVGYTEETEQIVSNKNISGMAEISTDTEVKPDETPETVPEKSAPVEEEIESISQTENKITECFRTVTEIPDDGAFRKESYRKCKVRNGVLDIPEGFAEINSFTMYGIERSLITKIILPCSVSRINESAFENCTSLNEINIPDTLMVIKSKLFSGCTSLEKITLPLSVRKIEDYAFDGCTSLKIIDIQGGVTGIGQNAFSGCDNAVIRCAENSFVHKYCIKHNIKTELIF